VNGLNYHHVMERIEINPDICNGKPVIKGTRITVQTILEFLGAGDSIEEVLEGYPSFKQNDVQAAIAYNPSQPRKDCSNA
jgi:uncharacterized protein (DUF433 family)